MSDSLKRFGSIFPFMEAGTLPRQIGRLVANYDFIKSLVTYGSFDEYVFSNTSVSNLSTFADTVATWGLPDARIARVQYAGYDSLPQILQTKAFHVFHLGGWGRLAAGLHYIRAQHASNAWPITAVTHSLHGREVVNQAVRICQAGLASYDAIFCTSADGREALHRLLDAGAGIAQHAFAGQLVQLPLGIDDAIVDAVGDRARCRRRLEIAADAVVLLMLGRITPFQKMDLGPLLRVFARELLPNASGPLVLLLAGNAAPQELALVKRDIERCGISERVRLYANFPADQKGDILAASDILVSPVDNTQETFGLSLLEGLSAGLPVVASRFDGYKDLVDDSVDGFLIDTYGSGRDAIEEWFELSDDNVAQLFQSQGVAVDLPSLADRLLRLIRDESLRKTMGGCGRAKVNREYRWSRVIPRYEAEWDRLAVEAQRAGIRPAGPNPYNVGTARVFTHYPSLQLTPTLRVASTGIQADVTPYNETRAFLPDTVLNAIAGQAATAGEGGVTVADLVRVSCAPDAQAEFAILWLLKYGVLRVVGR